MKNIPLLVIAIFAAGCVSTPQQAANMDSMQLCRIIAAPLQPNSSKVYALQEIRARGENCSDQFAIMQMEQQIMGNSLNAIAIDQQISQPAPAPTTCIMQPLPNGAWQQICH